MWDKRISFIFEENKKFEVSREDFFLLERWENKMCLEIRILKEVEVIVFVDYELGLNEIYLVVRYVIIFVIIYFKNLEIRGK